MVDISPSTSQPQIFKFEYLPNACEVDGQNYYEKCCLTVITTHPLIYSSLAPGLPRDAFPGGWVSLLKYCPHAAWIRIILGEGRGGLLKVHILGSHPRLCILTSKYWSYRITALGWRTRKLGRTFYGLHLSANNLFGVFISGLSGLVVKSCLTLVIPWTLGCQAPLSIGFSRQEYCNGLPFPSPADLPHPGIEPRFPAL